MKSVIKKSKKKQKRQSPIVRERPNKTWQKGKLQRQRRTGKSSSDLRVHQPICIKTNACLLNPQPPWKGEHLGIGSAAGKKACQVVSSMAWHTRSFHNRRGAIRQSQSGIRCSLFDHHFCEDNRGANSLPCDCSAALAPFDPETFQISIEDQYLANRTQQGF
jgi:hypothetical protein